MKLCEGPNDVDYLSKKESLLSHIQLGGGVRRPLAASAGCVMFGERPNGSVHCAILK